MCNVYLEKIINRNRYTKFIILFSYINLSVATLRECFPTRVLLGTITNPLTPSDQCFERDITDDGSGSIKACLCNTDYCNDDVSFENEIFSGNDESKRKTISSPSRNQITTTRTPRQTTRQTTRQTFPPTTRRSFTQKTTTG